MILNINKPRDWTSFDVVAKLKGLLHTKKIGHAGTLDPLAEGVLVILTDNDTKKQDEIMKLPKTYIADLVFGVVTPSHDMEFLPEFKGLPTLALADISALLPQFTGKITQVAPAFSAKKVNGKVLYKEARKGRIDQLVLPSKELEIYKFDITFFGTKELETSAGVQVLPYITCEIQCSSGTYIRAIARDLGEKLNTGAVLFSLVRSAVGDFTIDNSTTIEELAAKPL